MSTHASDRDRLRTIARIMSLVIIYRLYWRATKIERISYNMSFVRVHIIIIIRRQYTYIFINFMHTYIILDEINIDNYIILEISKYYCSLVLCSFLSCLSKTATTVDLAVAVIRFPSYNDIRNNNDNVINTSFVLIMNKVKAVFTVQIASNTYLDR